MMLATELSLARQPRADAVAALRGQVSGIEWISLK
jgi:hypothetical protein